MKAVNLKYKYIFASLILTALDMPFLVAIT